MVVATAVLFYVSYWLLSKMEVVKWNHFVKSKVHDAVTSGSALALASAAFLAVYREGFETVLFYKALFISAGPTGGAGPDRSAGMLLGVAAPGRRLRRDEPVRRPAAAQAVLRGDQRLPVLHGVRLRRRGDRRAAGGRVRVPDAGAVGVPRVPALGHPSRRSRRWRRRGVLVALALVALVWTFVIEPRRTLAAERRRSDEAVA